MSVWVAFVDDEGPLHKPLRWRPPLARVFISPPLHMRRDSVGEVRTVLWRGPRSLAKVRPMDRASHVLRFPLYEGDTVDLTWDIGFEWRNSPGLPVSLQFAVEEAVRAWAEERS